VTMPCMWVFGGTATVQNQSGLPLHPLVPPELVPVRWLQYPLGEGKEWYETIGAGKPASVPSLFFFSHPDACLQFVRSAGGREGFLREERSFFSKEPSRHGKGSATVCRGDARGIGRAGDEKNKIKKYMFQKPWRRKTATAARCAMRAREWERKGV